MSTHSLRGNTSTQTIPEETAEETSSSAYPLSFEQRSLWLFDQMYPGNASYVINLGFSIEGRLDKQALERAVNRIVQRHAILRTHFGIDNGNPVQIIVQNLFIPLEITRLDGGDSQIQEAVGTFSQKPFDLSKGPLIRTALFELPENRFIFLISVHHIVFDGWSVALLYRELGAFYREFHSGCEANILDLRGQYGHYALLQQQCSTNGRWEPDIRFWEQYLEDSNPVVIPPDAPENRNGRPVFGTVDFSLPGHVTSAAGKLSRTDHTTLFTVYLAAFLVLVHRYSGLEDIVVGTPFANRDERDFDDLIGFFVNTLVIRTNLASDPTFRDVLRQTGQSAAEAFSHRSVPFEHLIERLNPVRTANETPFFQVLFSVDQESSVQLELQDTTSRSFSADLPPNIEFVVSITQSESSSTCSFTFNERLFKRKTVERLADAFRLLLDQMLDNPDQPVSLYTLIKPEQRKILLNGWAGQATDYPRNRCVHELVGDQIRLRPTAIAIVHHSNQVTYGHLDELAGKVAGYLHQRGITRGNRVGLMMDRSIEIIYTMLGILRLGAAYVPLDPRMPASRLTSIIDDAGLTFVVSRSEYRDLFFEGERIHWLEVEDIQAINPAPDPGPVTLDAGEAAYILYTSGSTGTPKGAAISHRGIVRLARNADYVQVETDDVFGHTANVSFDVSTFEIWGALMNGARLIVLDRDVVLSPRSLEAAIEQHGINTLFLTTALFHVMAGSRPGLFSSLKQLFVAGETLDPRRARDVLAAGPPQRFINAYGPTEATTWNTWYEVRELAAEARSVPIGKPMANNRIYILDERLNPVPPGVIGELFIGGDGVALGYINRPELTREHFLHDPFVRLPGARMYRTGDLARWLDSGDIDFIGRRDHQVKIRGYRIELSEIEVVLNRHPAVRESVVIVSGAHSDEKRLLAYVALEPGSGVTGEALRVYLQEQLPAYMVPVLVLVLERLPLSANGKIDRKALPEPASLAAAVLPERLAPRTELERALVTIWEQVLGTGPLGVQEDFFGLGGNSLLAVRLCVEIESRLGRNVTISVLFQARTVEALAALLEQANQAPTSNELLVPLQVQGNRPPIYLFHGIGGHVAEYVQLAAELSPDQPVYGIQSQGIDGRAIQDSSIKEMAERYLQVILNHQPEGPYILGGFCYAGFLALEVARQLEQKGKSVGLVILIEVYPPERWEAPIRLTWPIRYIRYFKRLMQMNRSQRIGELNESLQIRITRIKNQTFRKIIERYHRNERPLPQRLRYFYLPDAIYPILHAYEPHIYSGSVLMIQATETEERDPDRAWEGLFTGRVDLHKVKGSHFLLQENTQSELGRLIRSKLNQVLHHMNGQFYASMLFYLLLGP